MHLCIKISLWENLLLKEVKGYMLMKYKINLKKCNMAIKCS